MDRAEQNRLNLVANEIDLGFTLIESARLAFSMGHTEHGEKAYAKAMDACRGARRFLGSEVGDDSTDSLRDGVKRLQDALENFRAGSKDQGLSPPDH